VSLLADSPDGATRFSSVSLGASRRDEHVSDVHDEALVDADGVGGAGGGDVGGASSGGGAPMSLGSGAVAGSGGGGAPAGGPRPMPDRTSSA
jgi:hypothetical protein